MNLAKPYNCNQLFGAETAMKLTLYRLYGKTPAIRPAPVERQWMDDTPQSYAYRCLPLNIANVHGWELLCPCSFTAVWDGGVGMESVRVESDAHEYVRPISHFGSGILTFHVGAVFRTEPGYSLYATGPVNAPKAGIQALTGIIETDWAPYSFTMNWRFTTPGVRVTFDEGEPYCTIFPVARGLLESVEPEVRDIDEDATLAQFHGEWTESRRGFNKALTEQEAQAVKEKWQKAYYLGKNPDGCDGTPTHHMKLHLKAFVDKPPKQNL